MDPSCVIEKSIETATSTSRRMASRRGRKSLSTAKDSRKKCKGGTHISGQIIATSHDLTPNGGLVREIPLFQGNPGW